MKTKQLTPMNIKRFYLSVATIFMLLGSAALPSDAAAQEGDEGVKNYIIISKEHLTLTLYDERGSVIVQYPVAVGKNMGNKQRIGDYRTPEGEFHIRQIQSSTNWGHDFGDGLGFIEHCYGNWFFRLHTPPHTGIGIHGTHAPESIGTRATEGCIRLRNEDLDELRQYIELGMKVIIEPSQADIIANRDIEANPDAEAKPAQRVVTTEEKAEQKPAEKSVVKEQKSSTPAAEGDVWHTVADGDLVSKIAYKYGTTVSKIKALNPDVNIDRISIGQRIKVKGTAVASSKPANKSQAASDTSSKEVWHTVANGDYIGKIAQKYGTTTAAIKKLNPKLNVDRISIGQRIRVK